ncbi:MAG: leucine-rich repeat protein [bacterium]
MNRKIKIIDEMNIYGAEADATLRDIVSRDSFLNCLENYENIIMVKENFTPWHNGTFEMTAKTLIIEDAVNDLRRYSFKKVNTLVYLGQGGLPSIKAFKSMKINEAIFINSGFLKGKLFLLEGCTYIIENFDLFNDKENFIEGLNKTSDKIQKLIKDIIITQSDILTSFLINNNLVKYDVAMQCLDLDISRDKKMMLMDLANNSCIKEKEVYNKALDRKETLDLGIEGFTLKDFKRTFNCSIEEEVISIASYKLDEESIIFPGCIDGCNKYFIKNQKLNAKVKTISFEEGITVINGMEKAFERLTALEEIRLPSTLVHIDECVINSISDKVKVFIGEDKTYVVCNNNTLLRINDVENLKNIVIPNGVKKIAKELLNYKCRVDSVTFPSSIEEISHSSFSGIYLKEIIFNPLDSKLQIGEYAFMGNSLTNVILPEGTISISNFAFCACSKLDSLSIPSTLESISSDAFRACLMLSNVNISSDNKIFKVIDNVFYSDYQLIRAMKCYNNPELTIPNGIKEIGQHAFENIKTLEKIIFPNSVEIIQTCAFTECINLNTIKFPNNLKFIGQAAFYACDNLIAFEIPESVETIEDYTFRVLDNTNTKGVGVIYTEVESLPDAWYKGIVRDGRKVKWGKSIID